jgi:hypothetical protein
MCFDESVEELPALLLLESPQPLCLPAGHTQARHLQELAAHSANGLFRDVHGGICKF